MTPAKAGYTIKVGWFHIRSHLTKIIGGLGIITGYALEYQASWVQWLSDKPRGIATKWLGVTVFALGLYNRIFPPKRPATLEDPLAQGDTK